MKLWSNKKEKVWPQEGIDYIFVDNANEDNVTSIKVKKGEFTDVVYHYGKLQVVEGDQPTIRFDYFIDDPGTFDANDLISNQKFDILMGDIIVSIFDNNVLKRKNQINEKIRTNNSKKFNIQ